MEWYDYGYYINADQVEKGGTGYDISKILSVEIDRLQPDYSLYPSVDSKTANWRNRGRRFLPHAQPYRDLNNPRQIIPQWQKDLARWVDNKWIFRSCEFKDFIPRKGFKCSEYFFNQL